MGGYDAEESCCESVGDDASVRSVAGTDMADEAELELDESIRTQLWDGGSAGSFTEEDVSSRPMAGPRRDTPRTRGRAAASEAATAVARLADLHSSAVERAKEQVAEATAAVHRLRAERNALREELAHTKATLVEALARAQEERQAHAARAEAYAREKNDTEAELTTAQEALLAQAKTCEELTAALEGETEAKAKALEELREKDAALTRVVEKLHAFWKDVAV